MNLLTTLFGGATGTVLEAYGKLPFYQDYIAVLSSPEAVAWKGWLLAFAGRPGIRLPPGRWPFLFRQQRKGPALAGIIEQSSDGIRQFPFSLFVSLAGIRTGLLPAAAPLAWRLLDRERRELEKIVSIEECYSRLRGRQVTIEPVKGTAEPQLADALDNTEKSSGPLFLICPQQPVPLPPIPFSGSESLFLENWFARAAHASPG
ncbi:MAG: hypothetical protein ACOY4H_02155 [Thermodesulfobacteriota bacterium]